MMVKAEAKEPAQGKEALEELEVRSTRNSQKIESAHTKIRQNSGYAKDNTFISTTAL